MTKTGGPDTTAEHGTQSTATKDRDVPSPARPTLAEQDGATTRQFSSEKSQIDSDPNKTSKAPYTVFSKARKRWVIAVLIPTMLASPLTATIYFPLLPPLANQFNVSTQAINLTITIYIIFQAVSPLLFATASDTLGRRPIYLSTYILYTLASLGLALNKHDYAALLVLRAIQSLGASAVLAIAFGVVADLWPPAERGSVLGATQGAANLAVCVGPVLGGWIALASGGVQWTFWALTVFGSCVVLLVGVALPETARNLVGNGSVRLDRWQRPWYEGCIAARRDRRARKDMQTRESGNDGGKVEKPFSQEVEQAGQQQSNDMAQANEPRRRWKIPNPLAALRVIFFNDTALALWMAASPYAVWYCVQASLPPIYKTIYGFSELQIGLAYLPGGAAVVLGGYANGKLMNWNYRVTARRSGRTIDKVAGDDLREFPIERARARGVWYMLIAYTCSLAGYGWAASSHRVSPALPLILQFILAALCSCFQQTFNALLVDIYPQSPSTAAAASNITRCTLSAVAVALLQPLVDVMGWGWFFSLLAVLSGGGGMAANWAIVRYSMKWRQQRL